MATGFNQFSNSSFGGNKRAKDEQKEEEKRKKRIYSSQRINDILKDLKKGYEVDMTPFFENDTALRAANLTFMMTEEEYDKWLYYSANPVDFTEREVVFLNDKGRTLVKLRDYQKDYLHLVGDEVYDEDLGEFLPLNNKIIGMQSRQSSKCFSSQTAITLQEKIQINTSKISIKNFLIDQILKCLKWFDKFVKDVELPLKQK